MMGYVMVGTNNLDQSIKFYDELLEVLDLERTEKDEVCAGYSQKNSNGKIEFYVTKPFNKEKATVGNGTQISFYINNKEAVDLFHSTAISLGAKDEGAPGERYEGEYYSYIRDLDGNKICGYTYLNK